jgi:hypothetical protein
MPMMRRSAFGATTAAMSVTRVEGILGTKTSPPRMVSSELSTKRTACSSVIQKRVMRSSVMVTAPSRACRRNSGTTDPRLPTTLP